MANRSTTAAVAADTPPAEAVVRRAVLSALRIHRLALELAVADVDMVDVALRHRCISADQALASMIDMGIPPFDGRGP